MNNNEQGIEAQLNWLVTINIDIKHKTAAEEKKKAKTPNKSTMYDNIMQQQFDNLYTCCDVVQLEMLVEMRNESEHGFFLITELRAMGAEEASYKTRF